MGKEIVNGIPRKEYMRQYRAKHKLSHKKYTTRDIIVAGIDSFKECSDCNELKPLIDFHRSPVHSGGVNSKCKSCTNRRRQQNYYNNIESERKQAREYNLRQDKKILAAKKRKWAASNPDSIKNSNYKKLYGITLEEVLVMREKQNNRCLVCGNDFHDDYVVDHCHSTLKIRGLLHSSCNKLLGLAKDNISILLGAIYYLEAANGR